MQPYSTNEEGERVLAGSRRPDGTLRKERRIRAGYVPQDEQPVYQSTGTLSRQNIPKCPGLDPTAAATSSSSAAKSKAAKKNEKRKAKKAEGPPSGGAAPQQPQSSPQPKPAAPPAQPSAAASAQPPVAAAAAADGGASAAEKQIKALSKKVRQCDALLQRQAAGEALSQQEAEKVAKMRAWQEEIKELEHQLAKLGA